jgi:hypothetical protein
MLDEERRIAQERVLAGGSSDCTYLSLIDSSYILSVKGVPPFSRPLSKRACINPFLRLHCKHRWRETNLKLPQNKSPKRSTFSNTRVCSSVLVTPPMRGLRANHPNRNRHVLHAAIIWIPPPSFCFWENLCLVLEWESRLHFPCSICICTVLSKEWCHVFSSVLRVNSACGWATQPICGGRFLRPWSREETPWKSSGASKGRSYES